MNSAEIHELIINGEQFVAKKLVDTRKGCGNLSLPEEVRFLSANLVQLKRMDHFLKAFLLRAERESAEITCAITFFFFSSGMCLPSV